MAGDKRKGKVAAEPKKKKTRQEKEWDRVLSVPDTQGQPQRGIGLVRVHRGRGSSPRVSSHSSSYGVQAEVSRQSRQRHLLHLPGPVLGHMEDTHSHSRLRDRGELQLRR
jgi:hypothetical protein